MQKAFRPYLISLLITLVTFVGIGTFTSTNHIEIPQDINKRLVAGRVDGPQQTIPALENAYNSSVAILASNMRVIGSGVVLKHEESQPIEVLTALHVVKHMYPNPIFFGLIRNGQLHLSLISKIDTDNDLALLVTVRPAEDDGPEVPLAKDEPVLGSPAWVIGNPRGILGNISYGIISNILTVDDGSKYYRIDTALYYGNSGGGVFNYKGELIGIAHAVEVRPTGPTTTELVPGGGLAIALPSIKRLLK